MPKDIPVGNGNLLLTFDLHYRVRDVYFPWVGQENHGGGHEFRFGIWADGRFSWMGPEWDIDLRYRDDTLVTQVSLVERGAGTGASVPGRGRRQSERLCEARRGHRPGGQGTRCSLVLRPRFPALRQRGRRHGVLRPAHPLHRALQDQPVLSRRLLRSRWNGGRRILMRCQGDTPERAIVEGRGGRGAHRESDRVGLCGVHRRGSSPSSLPVDGQAHRTGWPPAHTTRKWRSSTGSSPRRLRPG